MCRYIEQHIEDRLTLSLLAKEFRLSPFHLQRTFKSVLGRLAQGLHRRLSACAR